MEKYYGLAIIGGIFAAAADSVVVLGLVLATIFVLMQTDEQKL
jgi:hypothetical protein